jgi:hypothetical protein
MDAEHIYRYAGRIVAGVTSALTEAKLADYSMIHRTVLEAAGERGRVVHQIAEMVITEPILGPVDPKSIAPQLQGYAAAVRRFVAETGFAVEVDEAGPVVERRVFCQQYRYAGTLDTIGRINGRRVLLDWKSGAKSPAHVAQVCLYRHGVELSPSDCDVLPVYLSAEGSYSLDPKSRAEHLALLYDGLAAVRCLNFRIDRGMWPKGRDLEAEAAMKGL